MNQPSEDIKRWTARRKAAAIIEIIKGKTAAAELARSHALTVAEIERWMDDFVSAIDCCTREVLGYALKRTGRAKTAERALEEALLARFGTLRGAPPNMLLCHDNGWVFGSRLYRALVNDFGLKQEYITPYTPQQNGLCERFIKTFKEEFCWCNHFQSIDQARLKLRA